MLLLVAFIDRPLLRTCVEQENQGCYGEKALAALQLLSSLRSQRSGSNKTTYSYSKDSPESNGIHTCWIISVPHESPTNHLGYVYSSLILPSTHSKPVPLDDKHNMKAVHRRICLNFIVRRSKEIKGANKWIAAWVILGLSFFTHHIAYIHAYIHNTLHALPMDLFLRRWNSLSKT